MRLSAAKLGLLASVFAVSFALPAMATPTLTFTLNDFGGTAGNFGTVALTNESNGVLVQVSPVAGTGGTGFVSTGAGQSLSFNLDVSSIVVVSAPTPSGFSGPNTTQAPSPGLHDNFAGYFGYAVDCVSACGNGGGAPYQGTLSFTINTVSGPALTAADFTTDAAGFYFASDICNGVTAADNCTGSATGTAASNVPGTPSTPVPEPLTLSLFGAGLAGAAAVRRRKKA